MPQIIAPTPRLILLVGLLSTLLEPIASARTVVATFDAPPQNLIDVDDTTEYPLEDGEYNIQEDGLRNLAMEQPIWNDGGWLEPIGIETDLDNLGVVGPNLENLPFNAVLTNLNSTIILHETTSWGDVRGATHVVMDVQGSFAGTGGISVTLHSDHAGGGGTPTFWSWGVASSANSVGLNPGDVAEWTTIMIPIIFPVVGDARTWNTYDFVPEEDVPDAWDESFSNVNFLRVHGITPDTKLDNVGFLFPDLTGDFEKDGDVDGGDFLKWQRGESPNPLSAADLADWQNNFGAGGNLQAISVALSAVPEPSSLLVIALGLLGTAVVRSRHIDVS